MKKRRQVNITMTEQLEQNLAQIRERVRKAIPASHVSDSAIMAYLANLGAKQYLEEVAAFDGGSSVTNPDPMHSAKPRQALEPSAAGLTA